MNTRSLFCGAVRRRALAPLVRRTIPPLAS